MVPRLPPLLYEFGAGVRELPTARDRLRRWLEGSVDDPLARHDLLLAATELCTEAVQRHPGGRVALRAWVEDRSVVVEVTAPFGGAAETGGDGRAGDGKVSSLAQSGSAAHCRSHILDQICDEVTRATNGSVRSVRCRRRTGRGGSPTR